MKTMLPLFLAVLLTGCAAHPPQPVEIDPSDMCAFCRMAISEKRYAAEAVDSGRNTFKFDDIGCMMHFARKRGWNVHSAAWFVRDYDAKRWLNATQAQFVHSPTIPTPMASGLIAAGDRAEAEALAARFHGTVLVFSDLWK